MGYKSELQSNNAELEEILAAIIALPDAGGSSPVPIATIEKDINFYDYDGTLLYSYTLEEAQALTELPHGPNWHENLVFKAWNWTLADIKSETEFADIGALYETKSGATELCISCLNDVPETITLNFRQYSANAVVVDWGDGSATETSPVNGFTSLTHTYEKGSYTISMFPQNGAEYRLGGNTFTTPTIVSTRRNTSSPLLKNVYLGNGCNGMANYAFYYGTSLKTISFGNFPYTISDQTFDYCTGIVAIILPVGSIVGAYAFRGVYGCKVLSINNYKQDGYTGLFSSLYSVRRINAKKQGTQFVTNEFYGFEGAQRIKIPDGTVSINGSFSYLYSVRTITLPSTVTSIGANSFLNATNIEKFRFLPTVPPTVANTNAFSGFPTTCVVEVPAGSLAAYQNATNYGTIAAQMVGV